MRVCKQGCDVFRFARSFENYFIKAIEHFFRVYIASSKHSESWENSRKVMQTLDYISGLHNYLEFSQPSSCLDEAI